MRFCVITLITLAFSGSVVANEALCPRLPVLPNDVDDLRMSEADCNADQYADSLSFLRSKFPKKIRSVKEIKEVTWSHEFWISYFNSLKFIEGYVLKQKAIQKGGAAKKAFCKFMSQANYVD